MEIVDRDNNQKENTLMATGISVGGLASGIDTNAIIDGLSAIEENKIKRVENKKKNTEKTQDMFDQLVSRLNGFSSKANELSKESGYNLYTTKSDDEEKLGISGGTDALQGEYDVEISQLARARKVSSSGFESLVTPLGFQGSFSLSASKSALENDPTKKWIDIEVNTNDTLKDIAAKFNAAGGSSATASVMTTPDGIVRLVLTGVDQGTDGFVLDDKDGLLGAAGLGIIQDGVQSARTENGLVLAAGGAASTTNTFDELAAGVGSQNITAADVLKFDINVGGVNTTFDAAVGDGVSAFNSIQDVLDSLNTHLDTTYGANVRASLNSAGEMVISNNGVEEVEFSVDYDALGDGVEDDRNAVRLFLGESKEQNQFTNTLMEGRKAFFTLDGVAMSSQSNTADKAVMGTKFHLRQTTDPGEQVHVSLKLDKDAVKNKIQAFVDEYNAVIKFIDENSDLKLKKNDDGKDEVDSKGALYGDTNVRRIKSELQRVMTSPIKELEGYTQYSSLARVGITTDWRNGGNLTIDDEKFKKALDTDFDGVKRLFMASGYSDNPSHEMGRFTNDTKAGTYTINADSDSIASSKTQRIGSILTAKDGDAQGLSVDAPKNSGIGSFTFVRGLGSQIKLYVDRAADYSNGLFKQAKETYSNRIDDYDERIGRLEEDMERFRTSLIAEFSAMEQRMSALTSQSNAFMAQIGSF
jgi:flagellar hook-associated protein 2